MFKSASDELCASKGDCYPAERRAEVDGVNERIYANFDNGLSCGTSECV